TCKPQRNSMEHPYHSGKERRGSTEPAHDSALRLFRTSRPLDDNRGGRLLHGNAYNRSHSGRLDCLPPPLVGATLPTRPSPAGLPCHSGTSKPNRVPQSLGRALLAYDRTLPPSRDSF